MLEKLLARCSKKNDLLAPQEQEFQILSRQLQKTAYLLDPEGNFHSSARKVANAKAGEELALQLVKILKTPVVSLSNWMCPPVYRDAVVFYDRNAEIVSVLNICFSCEVLTVGRGEALEADSEVFGKLRGLFLGIGHEINFEGNE